jgi:hypothetical protein
MKNRYKNNCVRAFLLVAILSFSLTVFGNDICRSVSYSYVSNQIEIEVLSQQERPKDFQPYNDSSSFKQRNGDGSFYLENIVERGKKLILSTNNIYINNPNKIFLHFHYIVSILQKSNTWHQSSDDDAFLHDYC